MDISLWKLIAVVCVHLLDSGVTAEKYDNRRGVVVYQGPVTEEHQNVTISGSSKNDRVFLNVRLSNLYLTGNDSIIIDGAETIESVDEVEDGSGKRSSLVLKNGTASDVDIRSSGPHLTVRFVGTQNSSFVLPYTILAVGDMDSAKLCNDSKGCTYDSPSGMLTFPYVPVSKSFVHCVLATPSETIYLDVKDIRMSNHDTLITTDSGGENATYSKSNASELNGKTLVIHGNQACVEYNGDDRASYFYILFRKIKRKVVHVAAPGDIVQGYERNTIVAWFFENVENLNRSALHFAIRGANLNASLGEFLMVGSGNSSQALRSSPAAVLTRNVEPGKRIDFTLNGTNGYVLLFMGDRQDQAPTTTGRFPEVLYLEWNQTGSKVPITKPASVTSKAALFLCVDVAQTNDSLWNATKNRIQEEFAKAANNYLSERGREWYRPERQIEPSNVMLPDQNVLQGYFSWGSRVRVLVSIERPDKAGHFFERPQLLAIYSRMTDKTGRVKLKGVENVVLDFSVSFLAYWQITVSTLQQSLQSANLKICHYHPEIGRIHGRNEQFGFTQRCL